MNCISENYDQLKSVREAEIPARINQTLKQVEHQNEIVAELLTRLSPILRNEPESSSTAEKARQCACTPLGESLDMIECKVLSSIYLLQSILNRLEL